jgi:hypothetical protein
LLLKVAGRVLGVGAADPGADDRTGGRPDAGTATAADRGTDRRPETSTQNGAANSLGISLVTQRTDLPVGELPARLIIVIRLRQRSGAHRECRQ